MNDQVGPTEGFRATFHPPPARISEFLRSFMRVFQLEDRHEFRAAPGRAAHAGDHGDIDDRTGAGEFSDFFASLFGGHRGGGRATWSGRESDIEAEVGLELETALGADVEVPALDGRATLKVPPGTQAGQRLWLRGKGLARRKNGTGDLYATVRLVLPRRLTDEQRRLIEKMRGLTQKSPGDWRREVCRAGMLDRHHPERQRAEPMVCKGSDRYMQERLAASRDWTAITIRVTTGAKRNWRVCWRRS